MTHLKVIEGFIPIKIRDILNIFMIYVLPNPSRNIFEICIILSDISIFIHSPSESGFVCEARQALEQPLMTVWVGILYSHSHRTSAQHICCCPCL